MAYTGFGEDFVQTQPRVGTLRRWLSGLFPARRTVVAMSEAATPRKLAGPVPGDRRTRNYLGDLDIEVGF